MKKNRRERKAAYGLTLAMATLLVLALQSQACSPAPKAAVHAAPQTVQQEKLLAHVENGFIDKSGTLAIRVSGPFHGKFSDGLARVWTSLGGKWGYIDVTGRLAIQPTYDWALPFSDGLAAVNLGGRISYPQFLRGADVVWADIEGGKWIFIDKKGNVVIETPYTEVRSFHDGLAPVKSNNKWGYIDKAGKIVVSPKFEDADELHDGMGAVLLGHKWGFIDKSGKQVVEPKYSSRVELIGGQIIIGVGFRDGLAWVDNEQGWRAGKKWGVIDTSGQFVIEPQYDNYGRDFSDGLSAVKVKGKVCIIDKSGKVLSETDYDDISEFSEGIASFRKGKQWGAIDRAGKIVIEPQFSKPFSFFQGLASVETERDYYVSGSRIRHTDTAGYYIDKSGTRVFAASDGWEFQNLHLEK
jgi:hypothetical protein